jgi:hypothetical protein
MPTPPRLTRRDIGPFLREHGFPIGDSTVKKRCVPSIGKGPPVAAWFMQRALYEPTAVLRWAEAQLRPTRSRAEQHVAP